MGEILVKNLGVVRIAGETPTAQEAAAITQALKKIPAKPPSQPSLIEQKLGGGPDQEIAARAAGEIGRTIPALGMPGLLSLAAGQIPAVSQGQGVEAATSGVINRDVARMIGATVGGLVGAGAGSLAGAGTPASLALGTAGMAAGAGLGTAAGSLTFDTFDDAVRYFQSGQAPKREPLEATKTAFSDSLLEAEISGAAPLLSPAFRALKFVIKKALGVSGAGEIVKEAKNLGINLSVLQTSKFQVLQGTARVLGVFPFVRGPIVHHGARAVTETRQAFDSLLAELGPNQLVTDLGVDLTEAAGKRFDKFRKIASAYYTNFNNLVQAAGNPKIVPMDGVRVVARDIITKVERGAVLTRYGKRVVPKGKQDDVVELARDLMNFPDRLTVEQFRAFQKRINDLGGELVTAGKSTKDLASIKAEFERALNTPDLTNLPEDQAVAIADALKKANSFYANAIKPFETATAKRFGRVDKTMFGPGAFKAGTINADEAFNVVFRAKSPGAIEDLRKLVGTPALNRAARGYFDRAVRSTFITDDAGAVQFDADKFVKEIGLNSPEGRKVLETALQGTGVDIKNIDRLVEAAKQANNLTVPNASVFIQRHVTISGLHGLIGAFVLGAGATVSPVKTIAAILLARAGGKLLTNPRALNMLLRAAEESVPSYQARALVLRAARLIFTNPDEPQATSLVEGARKATTQPKPARQKSEATLPEIGP